MNEQSSLTLRDRIRQQISPFPRVQRYATGWAGEVTFEEIADILTPCMTRRLEKWGMYGQDIPDSIQQGLMRLWEQLVVNPDLLAKQSKFGAMWVALAKCNCKVLAKQNRKYLPFTDLEAGGLLDIDEYGICGYNSPTAWWNSVERWATWATATDARMDITNALQVIADKYMDDINGLAALYILTTSAEFYATLDALNVKKSTVWERMRDIKRQLQAMLEEYAPGQRRSWRERLQAGEINPYLKVVEHYQDRPMALTAIYTLVTDVQPRDMSHKDRDRKIITYYREKCRYKLEAAYRQAVAI